MSSQTQGTYSPCFPWFLPKTVIYLIFYSHSQLSLDFYSLGPIFLCFFFLLMYFHLQVTGNSSLTKLNIKGIFWPKGLNISSAVTKALSWLHFRITKASVSFCLYCNTLNISFILGLIPLVVIGWMLAATGPINVIMSRGTERKWVCKHQIKILTFCELE